MSEDRFSIWAFKQQQPSDEKPSKGRRTGPLALAGSHPKGAKIKRGGVFSSRCVLNGRHRSVRTFKVEATQTPGVRHVTAASTSRLNSTILRQPSSRRSDRQERVPVSLRELAKNVKYPAPSRGIGNRSGLIGVVPGACRFQQATDYT